MAKLKLGDGDIVTIADRSMDNGGFKAKVIYSSGTAGNNCKKCCLRKGEYDDICDAMDCDGKDLFYLERVMDKQAGE